MIRRLSKAGNEWVYTNWASFEEIERSCQKGGIKLHDAEYEYFIIEFAYKQELYRQKIILSKVVKLLKEYGIITVVNGKHCFAKCVEGEEITLELASVNERLGEE